MWKLISMMALLCLAAACDLRTGRIDNRMILFGLMSGLGFAVCGGSFPSFAIGMAIPFLLFPFYCMRLIGAGDVKLFMMIGGFLGYPELVHSMGWMLLGILIWAGIYFYGTRVKHKRGPRLRWHQILKKRFPMAPGVLMGMVLYCISVL